ncbi:MAG: hypothetical protein ACJA0B_001773 [Alcanivorax borkumensis]|jgi:hypothetical protein|uniref:DUF4399 domain-containing protein n=2 Tax=Alcanivoracaceae TaxID=224372 RepID=Q0VPE0_ALCBS|nr:conserved hypothetical protein [Alcanivorax borkumensis SK2]
MTPVHSAATFSDTAAGLHWIQLIKEKTMRIPFQRSLLVAVIASTGLLQACSDNSDGKEAAAPAADAPAAADHSNHMNTDDSATKPAATGIVRSPAPEGAAAEIVSPTNGATVSSPVKVVFGLEGMEVAPAGNEQKNSGHHHLLIDLDTMPNMDMPLPANDQVVHFGKGQTETELELEPGTHTLQLLLGDYRHVPHQPPVTSEKITITVE